MSAADALQGALAGEHAAIWGYGVVGAEVTDAQLSGVRVVEQAHRARRGATANLLRSLDVDPVRAQPYYELPFPVDDPTSGLRLAVHLEQGVAAAWRFVLGQIEDAELRRTALGALTESAIQATRWRLAAGTQPATVAFPGQ